jgi:heptosyltransferase-3
MTPPKRILVIATRRIGDVLLTTPLLRSLKRAWPDATVDVLVFENTKYILHQNPDINNIITINERPRLISHLKLLKRLWRAYDLSVSALPGDRPTLYAWLAGHYSIGLLLDEKKQKWKQRLLNQWVPFDGENTHTVSMHLALAQALGIKPIAEVVLQWNEQQAQRVDQLLASEHAYAVLHLYPKFSYKMWHTDGWIALTSWLIKQNLRVIITGSAAADEMQYIAEILKQLPANVINLSGQLDFGEIAYLLSSAIIYVGPDTSISHIAAAMNTPTIALFGPSNPIKWGPWPKHTIVLTSPYQLKGSQHSGNVTLIQGIGNCVPCFQEGCERHINSPSDCLQKMSVDTVIAAAEKILRKSLH